MANLYLVPNPSILAVMMGIFFTVYFTIKKLFIAPYLGLRERRLKATTGSQAGASELLAETAADSKMIEEKIQAAGTAARQTFETSKQEARVERDKIIAAAEQEAKKTVKEIESAIAGDMKIEKEKIPQIVEALTNALFEKAIN